eukprot:UN03143
MSTSTLNVAIPSAATGSNNTNNQYSLLNFLDIIQNLQIILIIQQKVLQIILLSINKINYYNNNKIITILMAVQLQHNYHQHGNNIALANHTTMMNNIALFPFLYTSPPSIDYYYNTIAKTSTTTTTTNEKQTTLYGIDKDWYSLTKPTTTTKPTKPTTTTTTSSLLIEQDITPNDNVVEQQDDEDIKQTTTSSTTTTTTTNITIQDNEPYRNFETNNTKTFTYNYPSWCCIYRYVSTFPLST